MGLDISVLKPVSVKGMTQKEIDNEDGLYVYTLKDLKGLSKIKSFKRFTFKKENEYFDAKKALISRKLNPDNYDLSGVSYGKKTVLMFRNKKNNKGIKIANPPTYTKSETCIAFREVGYQRKGANNKFYEDEIWDSPPVTSLKVLNEHYEKYFSKATPESKGGFGSGVEFDLSNKEMRERFTKNILNVFKPGMIVLYH